MKIKNIFKNIKTHEAYNKSIYKREKIDRS